MSERLIRLRLSPWMVQLISTVLESFSSSKDAFLVFTGEMLAAEPDEDLHSIWRQSLGEQLELDFGFLRKTLARLRAHGIADLDTQNAEAFLRAANAIRLNLQRNALRSLPKETLQGEPIDTDLLQQNEQVAYACYTLLSEIQGQIIAQIEQRENAPSTPPEEYPDDFFNTAPDPAALETENGTERSGDRADNADSANHNTGNDNDNTGNDSADGANKNSANNASTDSASKDNNASKDNAPRDDGTSKKNQSRNDSDADKSHE